MRLIIKNYLGCLKAGKLFLVLALFCFLFGAILGVLLNSTKGFLFSGNIYNQYIVIFNPEISLFGFLLKKLFASIGVLLVVFVCSLTVWLIPINCIIFIYQGFVLTASAICYFSLFSVSGIVVYVLIVLPCSVIRFIAFAFCCCLNYSNNGKCKKAKNSLLLLNIFTAFMFLVIAFIWELIFIGLVIRPLNIFV